MRSNTFASPVFDGEGTSMHLDNQNGGLNGSSAITAARTAAAGKKQAGGGGGGGGGALSPPPPHSWYHGSISRETAEERLNSDPTPGGSFLVRARNVAEGSYAISLMKPGRKPIHYVMQLPSNSASPLLLQSKAVPAANGSTIPGVIAHFSRFRELPFLLQHHVAVPSNAKKLMQVARAQSSSGGGGGGSTTGSAPFGSSLPHQIAYDLLQRDFDRYTLSTAYCNDATGVYYQTFVRVSQIREDIPLFTQQTARNMAGVATIKFVGLPRQPAPAPSVAVFLRVGRSDMDQHLLDGSGSAAGAAHQQAQAQATFSIDGVDGDESYTDAVQYTAVGGDSGGGTAQETEDAEADSIEYTAIDHVAVDDRKTAALTAAKQAAERMGGGGGDGAGGGGGHRAASYSRPVETHQLQYGVVQRGASTGVYATPLEVDAQAAQPERSSANDAADYDNIPRQPDARRPHERPLNGQNERPLSVVTEAPYATATQELHGDVPRQLDTAGSAYQPASDASTGTHYTAASPGDAESYQSVSVNSVESAVSWTQATTRRPRLSSNGSGRPSGRPSDRTAGLSHSADSDGPLPPRPVAAAAAAGRKPIGRAPASGGGAGANLRGGAGIKSSTGNDYTPHLRTIVQGAPVVQPVEFQYKAMSRDGGDTAPDSVPLWLHNITKPEAQVLLQDAGGMDGLFLVRPLSLAAAAPDAAVHVMSVVAKRRVFHQLIERNGESYVVKNGGNNAVNKAPSGGWGGTLDSVVTKIQARMERELKVSMMPIPCLTTEDV